MNKEAIEQIQVSANIPALIKHLAEAGTDIPLLLSPDQMGVQSLEKFMANASRYRMNYTTTSIDDFIEYTKKFEEDGTGCFVNAERMTAKSIFDLGTINLPGHKEHTAGLSLKKTVAFKALLQSDGAKLTQKHAAEFLEDWADCTTILNQNGEAMTLQQASKALRDLTIETARELNSKVSDFSESMSAMERVEAKNQDSLPSSIIFSCIPYLALQEREFTIRLSIITGGDRPSIGFRVVRIEAVEEEIAMEFKDLLVKAFSDLDLKTYIGEA